MPPFKSLAIAFVALGITGIDAGPCHPSSTIAASTTTTIAASTTTTAACTDFIPVESPPEELGCGQLGYSDNFAALLSVLSGLNFGSCAKACYNTPRCSQFVLVDGGVECFLMSADAHIEPDPDAEFAWYNMACAQCVAAI
ncbi:hypothetical protein ACJZ2D_003005 [Fusarium nematophilum]